MNKNYKQYQRVVITGEMDEIEGAFRYCSRNGYRITYSNPKISKNHVDTSHFKIVAEKEIEVDI